MITQYFCFSTSFWSEWGDSNSRLRHPKCRALPTGLHPDILLFFLWFYGLFFAVFSVYGRSCGQGQKQRIGKGRFLRCFRRFLPLYSNGLDFRRSSQTTRATNCATPGDCRSRRPRRPFLRPAYYIPSFRRAQVISGLMFLPGYGMVSNVFLRSVNRL